MKYLQLIVLLLGISLGFSSCESEDVEAEDTGMEMEDENNQDDSDHVVVFKIRLTDNPIELRAVNIDLQDLVVVDGDELIALDTKSGIYNLLDFQNGIDTLITNQGVMVDHIDQLIFNLGDMNSIVTLAGEEFSLILPDDSANYLTLDLDRNLEELDELDLLLDFDACQSVHRLDDGQWVLEPVLRVLSINGASQSFDPEKIQMIKDELDITEAGTVVNASEISLCMYDFSVLRVDLSTLDAVEDESRSFIFGPDCKFLLKARDFPLSEISDLVRLEATILADGMNLYENVREYSSQDIDQFLYEFKMLGNGQVHSFIVKADGELVCR